MSSWWFGSGILTTLADDLGERILGTQALVEGRVYVRSETHVWPFGD